MWGWGGMGHAAPDEHRDVHNSHALCRGGQANASRHVLCKRIRSTPFTCNRNLAQPCLWSWINLFDEDAMSDGAVSVEASCASSECLCRYVQFTLGGREVLPCEFANPYKGLTGYEYRFHQQLNLTNPIQKECGCQSSMNNRRNR